MLTSALGQLLSFLGTHFSFLLSLLLSPCNHLIQISLPCSLLLCLPGPGVQQHLGVVVVTKAGLERSVLWPWGDPQPGPGYSVPSFPAVPLQ